jgi:hypothetical protein
MGVFIGLKRNCLSAIRLPLPGYERKTKDFLGCRKGARTRRNHWKLQLEYFLLATVLKKP